MERTYEFFDDGRKSGQIPTEYEPNNFIRTIINYDNVDLITSFKNTPCVMADVYREWNVDGTFVSYHWQMKISFDEVKIKLVGEEEKVEALEEKLGLTKHQTRENLVEEIVTV